MNFRFPKFSPTSFAQLVPSASQEALELMQHMPRWAPAKRPTAMQVLQYPFFQVGYKIPRGPFPFREQTNSISNSNNSIHFNPRSNGKGMYHGASKALGDFPAVAAVKPSWQQKPLGHRPASQTQDPLGDEFTIEADYVCSNLA